MKRFSAFIKSLYENMQVAEPNPQLLSQLDAQRKIVMDLNKELQTYVSGAQTTSTSQREAAYQKVEELKNRIDQEYSKYQDLYDKTYPVDSPQWNEKRAREAVHPVARRAIEMARASGNPDVYIPDPDDMTKQKFVGRLNPGESDYEFSRRLGSEWDKNKNNPDYKGWQGDLFGLSGYRDKNYSQEDFDDMDQFDIQGDPRVYDQTTGSTRGEMEAGRQEQERDEANIGAWWDQGGGSNNPSVQGWRTTGFERAAASRAKNREQDQHFDNVERSMAGEVGPTQRFKDNFAWSSMSNMAKATGVKGPDLERITSGERRKKSIEIMRSARQQEQQRRNERIEQERKDREQAQKEQAARHEEMRKREQERSKPIARPAGGREEPPPSGQTALRV